MHVLYFSRDYTPHDNRFLTALAGSEYQVSYLRLERGRHLKEQRELPNHVELVSWMGGESPYRSYNAVRLLTDLKRVIREIQPEIIHAGPIPDVGLLAALTAFRPLVSMSWGSDLLCDVDRSRWSKWAASYTLKRSSVMIGDCNAVRQKAISLGFPSERIVIFPWGVDLRHFIPRESSVKQELDWADFFVLLSTRSWEPIYGVDIVARGFVEAAQKRDDLRLLILSGGSQSDLLKRIFIEADVMDRVHFAGQVKLEDLPMYYRAADVYVSASHSDGSSVSLMEALACGCPALVSDIPGNREWIEHEKQGWLFGDGDVNGLASAMIHAVQERTKLPEMAAEARSLAEERANWEANTQVLLQAYALALQNG